jgi:hypothetical protein
MNLADAERSELARTLSVILAEGDQLLPSE